MDDDLIDGRPADTLALVKEVQAFVAAQRDRSLVGHRGHQVHHCTGSIDEDKLDLTALCAK